MKDFKVENYICPNCGVHVGALFGDSVNISSDSIGICTQCFIPHAFDLNLKPIKATQEQLNNPELQRIVAYVRRSLAEAKAKLN